MTHRDRKDCLGSSSLESPKTAMTAETPNFWIIGINIETVAQTIRIT